MIKPCPWCGGTSVSVVEKEFRYRMAVCDECDAHAPDVRHDTLAQAQAQVIEAEVVDVIPRLENDNG